MATHNNLEEQDVRARVSPEWAAAIEHHDIWQFNDYSAEDIGAHVKLELLGGLVVVMSGGLWTPREAERNRDYWSQVNLAFGEPARATDTQGLITAAIARDGEDGELTQLLQERYPATSDRDFNETWLFPVSALTIVEPVEA